MTPATPSAPPVDAAAAFAGTYRRWFDDARALAEENAQQARPLLGARVADVLTLWDDGARAWLSGAPTVLRFEEIDLAAFTMRLPHLALFFGSIDTASPVATFGPPAGRARGTDAPALRWESFRPCSYAVGRTVRDLVFVTDERGLLVELEVLLDDGGRLLLGDPPPAWALPHAG